jgi:hypothetical protein
LRGRSERKQAAEREAEPFCLHGLLVPSRGDREPHAGVIVEAEADRVKFVASKGLRG